jgi:hypothetical protein
MHDTRVAHLVWPRALPSPAARTAALAPTEAVILTDVDCAVGNAGQVAKSLTLVRPNGGVTLTCHFNPGSEPFIPGED